MVWNIGVDRTNPSDVIGAITQMWPQFADLHAAFAVFLERKRRFHQRARFTFSLDSLARQRLAVVFLEHRFRIKGIHMGHAAVHE